MSDLPVSCEATDFPKPPFLSTSQLGLLQRVEFNPRWEFLLQSVSFGRLYCLLGNSGNNLKLCLSLNKIFIVQEIVEEPILTIVPLLDQL